MTSANIFSRTMGFGTFDALRVDRPATATELVGLLVKEVYAGFRHTPGFVSSRIHMSLDGTTVVSHGRWTSDADYRNSLEASPGGGALRTLSSQPGVLSATAFGGAAAGSIEGPVTTEPPGIVAVATRHVAGHESARAVGELLLQSGEWKRHTRGFIAATAYISPDGMTYVTYPQWIDEPAYHTYMADPRIAEVQEEIARLEVAPPEFLLCRMVAHIKAA